MALVASGADIVAAVASNICSQCWYRYIYTDSKVRRRLVTGAVPLTDRWKQLSPFEQRSYTLMQDSRCTRNRLVLLCLRPYTTSSHAMAVLVFIFSAKSLTLSRSICFTMVIVLVDNGRVKYLSLVGLAKAARFRFLLYTSEASYGGGRVMETTLYFRPR